MFSKVSFEIELQRDGRWMAEATYEQEEDARVMLAKLLRSRDDCTAGRIMKQTTSMTGNTRSGEIFQQARDAKDAPLTLTGNPETAPVCKDADTCFALPARMAMARLLKMFLDKFQIGPMELLHSQSFLKKFDEATTLIAAGFHQVGTAQAKQLGITTNERIAALMDFYKQIHARAKRFMDMRKSLPGLLADDINTTHAAVLRDNAAAAQVNFNHLVTFEFQTGMYVAREQKLSVIVTWFNEAKEKELRAWLDEWIADYLCFPEIIDGLLGQQFNFYEFLLRVIEVALGNKKLTKSADSPQLTSLRTALASGALPMSQTVLVDRLVREIRTEKPLDRRDIEREEILIKDLERALRMEGGAMLGGRATEDAIAARKLRERKRKLRAMGLDDVADNI